jgi:hypothetical protein
MPLPHWEEDTPENQARLRTLQAFIRYSSRYRMLCEVDVLQYYEQFLVLSKLMTITGFLTSNERDTAFWCRFHLDDCRVLQPHALDTPLHFEDVFMSARAAFLYKSEPTYMPLPIPTSPPPISSPIPLAAPPHPSPKRPPEILRPASAPPILQRFNDPGEGDLCPQVNLGALPGTYHGPCAHGTSPPSPPSPVPFSPSSSPTRPPSPPSSPLLLPPLLEPSPSPQLPIRPSSLSLLSDLLHTPLLSPSVPILSITSSLPHSRLDKQSIIAPTPPHFPQLPTRLLLRPCDVLPASSPPSPPPLAHDMSLPPALNPSLTSLSWPLDCVLMAPRNVPPPLAFPPLPPPQPPNPVPATSVEAQPPSSTPSLLSAFPSQLFDCLPTDPPSPPSPIGASSLPPLSALDNSPTVPVHLRPEPSCLHPMPSRLCPMPLRLCPMSLCLRPMPTQPPPLPPDASLASLSSPLQLAHATASSPPSHPSLPLASLLQLLNGSRSSPHDPPLRLVILPTLPPRPPDPMSASTARP